MLQANVTKLFVCRVYLGTCVSGLSSLQVCFAISFCNKICFDTVCFMCLLQLLVFAAVWFVMLKSFQSHVPDAGLWLELYWQSTCTTTICILWCFVFLQPWLPSIQCQLCPMTFSDQSAISVHYDTAHRPSLLRPEHPEAKHPCEVCGRKFTKSSSMYKHMRTVHGVGDVKTFQCDVCSKVFKQKCDLKKHLSTVHGPGDQPSSSRIQCQLCSMTFSDQSAISAHYKTAHAQNIIRAPALRPE